MISHLPSPESLTLIALIGAFGLVLYGMFKPMFLLIGYMVIVYCKLSSHYPFLAVIQAEAVFGFVLLLRALMSSGALIRIFPQYSKVNRYLLLFMVSVALSYFFAWNKLFSWDNAVFHFIKVLFIAVPLIILLKEEKDIWIFTWGLVLMYVYLAYEPMYGFLTGTGGGEQMYGSVYVGSLGILSGHVALANNMNQMIPIALFLSLSVKRKVAKTIAIVAGIIFFIALIGSASRGGIVGFVFFLIILMYFGRKKLKHVAIIFIVVISIVGLSSTIISTAGRVDVRNVEGRLIRLIHGLEIIRKGNIIGVGPGCYRLASSRYFGHTMDAHNLYGELAGDLGIPGIITWCLLMFYTLKNFSVVRKRLDEAGLHDHPIYMLNAGFQTSLIVRLFVALGSHGLYFFFWYTEAAASVALLKIAETMSSQAHPSGMKANPIISSLKPYLCNCTNNSELYLDAELVPAINMKSR